MKMKDGMVKFNTRWDFVVSEVEYALNLLILDEHTEVTPEEVNKVISVLKNNIPFEDTENELD